ncbi:MAG: hypothetical protein RSE36_00125 [Oscillospiraceae bacterium]
MRGEICAVPCIWLQCTKAESELSLTEMTSDNAEENGLCAKLHQVQWPNKAHFLFLDKAQILIKHAKSIEMDGCDTKNGGF